MKETKKYQLLRDGLPCFDCAVMVGDESTMKAEVARLEQLQEERNALPVATGRGAAFLNIKTNHQYSLKPI